MLCVEANIERAVALVNLLCDGHTKAEVQKALDLSVVMYRCLFDDIRRDARLPSKVRNYPRNRDTIMHNARLWRVYALELAAIRNDYEARLYRHPINE